MDSSSTVGHTGAKTTLNAMYEPQLTDCSQVAELGSAGKYLELEGPIQQKRQRSTKTGMALCCAIESVGRLTCFRPELPCLCDHIWLPGFYQELVDEVNSMADEFTVDKQSHLIKIRPPEGFAKIIRNKPKRTEKPTLVSAPSPSLRQCKL